LIERGSHGLDKLKSENPNLPGPVERVTSSGNGLDPALSPAAALFQVPRLAKVRNMSEGRLRPLVAPHGKGRTLGKFGEPWGKRAGTQLGA
jgi:K+-transporting ATPase ATPase C chain